LNYWSWLFLRKSGDGWLPDVLSEGSARIALAEVGLEAWELKVEVEVLLICKKLVKVVLANISGGNRIVSCLVIGKLEDAAESCNSAGRLLELEGVPICG